MIDLKSDENYLMESLDNFKPPKDTSVDKTNLSNVLGNSLMSTQK